MGGAEARNVGETVAAPRTRSTFSAVGEQTKDQMNQTVVSTTHAAPSIRCEIEGAGVPMARIAGLAGVNATRLYYNRQLTDEEQARIRRVLAQIASGDIDRRAPRFRDFDRKVAAR